MDLNDAESQSQLAAFQSQGVDFNFIQLYLKKLMSTKLLSSGQ